MSARVQPDADEPLFLDLERFERLVEQFVSTQAAKTLGVGFRIVLARFFALTEHVEAQRLQDHEQCSACDW